MVVVEEVGQERSNAVPLLSYPFEGKSTVEESVMTDGEKAKLLEESMELCLEILTSEAKELGQKPTPWGYITYGWFRPQDQEERRYMALLRDERYECWDKVLEKSYYQPWLKIYVGVDQELMMMFIDAFLEEITNDPPVEIPDVGFKNTFFVLKEEYRNVKEQAADSQE